MKKADFIFWFDIVYFIGVIVGFFFLTELEKTSYINLLTTSIMPILALINAGISGSIWIEKKTAVVPDQEVKK